jgi:hypothetical protein
MLPFTAINGVFVLLMVSYSPVAFAAVAKCFAGGSFDEAVTKIGTGAPESAACTTYCMNQTKGMLSTLQ